MRGQGAVLVICSLATAIGARSLGLDTDIFDGEDEHMPMPPNPEGDSLVDTTPIEFETMPYRAPTLKPSEHTMIMETFQDPFDWIPLENSEKFKGEWKQKTRMNDWIVGDVGLVMDSSAAYHGLAKKLDQTFVPSASNALFASMEVQWEKPVNCGGAYFKLFHSEMTNGDISTFDDTTNYSIMFGPDKCGYLTNKVHFIIKHPNPSQPDKWVEEHLEKAPKLPTSSAAHQFGFALRSNGKAEIWVDGKIELEGDMKTVFKGGFANEATIPDPNDEKPQIWDDDKMIEDMSAVKPSDWDEDEPLEIIDEEAVMPEGWLEDEPLSIPNPEAEKPEDWVDSEDGIWSAPNMKNPKCYIGCGKWTKPMMRNPKYKGKWTRPMIDNPAYQGVWSPRNIPNPAHYNIEEPFTAIQAFDTLGFELWTVDPGATFDNIIITTKEEEFLQFIEQTYRAKADLEQRNVEKILKREAEEMKNTNPAGSESENTTWYDKVILALMIMSDNRLASFLTLGLTVATSVYVISRMFRKTVTHATASSAQTTPETAKPSTATPSAATTADSAEKTTRKGSAEDKTTTTTTSTRKASNGRPAASDDGQPDSGEVAGEKLDPPSVPTSATEKEIHERPSRRKVSAEANL